MIGHLVIIKADGQVWSARITRELSATEQLDAVSKAIGGGYVEQVPGFIKMNIKGIGNNCDCVAFCDEDGKGKHLPINGEATRAWHNALLLQGLPGLIVDDEGHAADVLCGDVAVLTGDKEFMDSLREDGD